MTVPSPRPKPASLRRRRGATGVEYGLLVGLLAMAAIVAISSTGTEVAAVFDRAAGTLNAIELPDGSGDPAGGGADDGDNEVTTPEPTPSTVYASRSEVPVFTDDCTEVVLTNPGTAAAAATSAVFSPDYPTGMGSCTNNLSQPPCGASLAPGSSCAMGFMSTMMRSYDHILTYSFDDGAVVVLHFTGTSTDEPNVAMPQYVNSGAGGYRLSVTPSCQNYEVRNSSSVPVRYLNFDISENPARFGLCTPSANACAGEIAPGASCNIGLMTQPGGDNGYGMLRVRWMSTTTQFAMHDANAPE